MAPLEYEITTTNFISGTLVEKGFVPGGLRISIGSVELLSEPHGGVVKYTDPLVARPVRVIERKLHTDQTVEFEYNNERMFIKGV